MSEQKNVTKYVIPLFALLCFIFFVALFQSRKINNNKGNDSNYQDLKFEVHNFPELDFVHYALWGVKENGDKEILKRFNVYENGLISLDEQSFDKLTLDKESVYASFEISIEKLGDRDELQSECVLLRGTIQNNIAELKPIIDLSNISGSFMIATPTDGTAETNEKSGIWFTTDLGNANPTPSLNLPDLEGCWTWSAYLLYRDQYLRIGEFSSPNSKDNFSDYSFYLENQPNIPGEDFLRNLDESIDPPINVTNNGNNLIVDIEPKSSLMQLSNTSQPLVKILEYNFTGEETARIPIEMMKSELPSLRIEISE